MASSFREWSNLDSQATEALITAMDTNCQLESFLSGQQEPQLKTLPSPYLLSAWWFLFWREREQRIRSLKRKQILNLIGLVNTNVIPLMIVHPRTGRWSLVTLNLVSWSCACINPAHFAPIVHFIRIKLHQFIGQSISQSVNPACERPRWPVN